MKFQPGQSGNPAGRPLGARNKKTIAREEELAERAEEAVDWIISRAKGGNPVAMRICAEWAKPGGNSRALALELPRITCAADAQAALDMVIEEFGQGEITVREFPTMLGSVDRMARVAQRIDAMRERERERYAAQRVHGVHPDMLPKPPPGWSDPMEAFLAALERGEDPDDPGPSADDVIDERLYSSVNFEGEEAPSVAEVDEQAAEAQVAPSLPCAADEGGSPGLDPGEPGGGLSPATDQEVSGPEAEGLYLSVNSEDEEPASTAEVDEPAEDAGLTPSLPRAAREGGDPGLDPGEPGGGTVDAPEGDPLYSPVNLNDVLAEASPPPGAADAAPPSPCGGGIYEPPRLNSG